MDIQNVVALVTGAGSGLGLATCQALVKAGAKVMAVDVDEERLVNSVLPLGLNVRIQRIDVSNDAEVKAAVDFAESEGLAVHPMCPFVVSWLEKHPECTVRIV